MSQRSCGLWVFAQFLLSLCLLTTVARANEPFVIVSDVDDTVKITDVCHRNKAVKNLYRDVPFPGMSELYNQLLGPDSPRERLSFLSGGVVEHTVGEFLEKSGFPAHTLHLRGRRILIGWSVYTYKTNQMQQMYGAARDTFILIGDDTETDPDVYETFSAPRRDQILATYIHRITGCPFHGSGTPFVTAFDIATHEFLANRLTEEQAHNVGTAVLAAPDHTLVPPFQGCPKEFQHLPNLPDALIRIEGQINARLAEVCASRTVAMKSNCCTNQQ